MPTPRKAAPSSTKDDIATTADAAPKTPKDPAKPTTKDSSGVSVNTEIMVGGTDIRVERAPADWQNFAPPAPRPVGALRRSAQRAGRPFRFLGHEWTLTVLGGLTLAVLANYGGWRDPLHTLPQDTWTPAISAYLVAWTGFALLHFPADLWQINAFFPSGYGLAYNNAFLGYAPFALFGTGPDAAVLRYNIIFVLAQALCFVGAYALVRQLGAGRVAAAVAGIAFAAAPWRLGQAGDLAVLSAGGIALALAMLARGHGVRWRISSGRPGTGTKDTAEPTPPKRPGWAIAGWVCAAWQVSVGIELGLVFIYVMLGLAVVTLVWWLVRSRRLPSRGLLIADLGGGLLFVAVCGLLSRPYRTVLEHYPSLARTDEAIAATSPPVRAFFTAPEHSLVWGDLHAPARALLSQPDEMALLPGFALLAFAAAGLVVSVWRPITRLALLAGVVVTALLALGTNGPAGGQGGYLAVSRNLPGFDAVRMPGHFIVWTTLLLALLAAGGVSALTVRAGEVAQRRGLPRPTMAARLALLLTVALVAVEGVGTIPHPQVPARPAALATARAPYLVLPSADRSDAQVMLWSTDRFADVVNGDSGLVPTELAETRERMESFPDSDSVDYLRSLGVRTVVVLVDQARGTPWESVDSAAIDDLGISRDITDDAVTFDLQP